MSARPRGCGPIGQRYDPQKCKNPRFLYSARQVRARHGACCRGYRHVAVGRPCLAGSRPPNTRLEASVARARHGCGCSGLSGGLTAHLVGCCGGAFDLGVGSIAERGGGLLFLALRVSRKRRVCRHRQHRCPGDLHAREHVASRRSLAEQHVRRFSASFRDFCWLHICLGGDVVCVRVRCGAVCHDARPHRHRSRANHQHTVRVWVRVVHVHHLCAHPTRCGGALGAQITIGRQPVARHSYAASWRHGHW